MDLRLQLKNNVNQALVEDIGTGDLTASLIPAEKAAIASVISRENAVLCGTNGLTHVSGNCRRKPKCVGLRRTAKRSVPGNSSAR